MKVQEKVVTTWLFDKGADAHVMLNCVWEQLGDLAQQTTNVTLRGANEQDFGSMGEVQVRTIHWKNQNALHNSGGTTRETISPQFDIVRGVSTHPRKAVVETACFDYAEVKNNQQGAEAKILAGVGSCGKQFARAVHRKGAKFEDLEQFLSVLQTRYGNIPLYCDQEEWLREFVHSTAGRLGMPTRVTAVEQSHANGRAEQRVRALREGLHIVVEDARHRSAEIKFDHIVAQWAK